MPAKPTCYYIIFSKFNQLPGLHFIHIEIRRIWGMASTHLLAPSLIDPTRPRKLPSQLLPLPFNRLIEISGQLGDWKRELHKELLLLVFQ